MGVLQYTATALKSCSVLSLSLFVITAGVAGLYFYFWHINELTLPFRNLPGPPSGHWFWGCVPTILQCEPRLPPATWIQQYGPSIRYRAFFGLQRFVTIDPSALRLILSNPDMFPKPGMMNYNLDAMLGNGLLVAHAADHRKQRKALSPGFSHAVVREMVPTFYDKAYELKDKLISITDGLESEDPAPSPQQEMDYVPGGKKIDMLRYFSRTTLDLIGICGFDYDFKALSGTGNELSNAYVEMFREGLMENYGAVLRTFLPILGYIPTERTRTVAKSKEITRQFGMRTVQEKKAAILAEHSHGLEKKEDIGRDLISILIKANMAADLDPKDKLSDEDILNQITTFMLAGNETSSTALSWIIYILTQHPEAQARLRSEVMAVDDERPSIDTLNSLTYMDAVIREVLRMYPPVPVTMREAAEDVVLPLRVPVRGRNGNMMDSVTISKGTLTFIPILICNNSPLIWGEDADKFVPERFLSETPTMGNDKDGLRLPGVWGNLLTFLGGIRNCIGYRFAIAEIKAILFVMMRNFEFQELATRPEMMLTSSIVLRPKVRGEEELGLQMPVMVKPLAA